MNKLGILCVTQDYLLGTAVKEQLSRNLSSELEIATADSIEEALEVIQELWQDGIQVAVVVSDHREVSKLKEYHSAIQIIVLSAVDFVDILVSTKLNFVHLYNYIKIPWSELNLILTVEGAIENYQLLAENKELKKYKELNYRR